MAESSSSTKLKPDSLVLVATQSTLEATGDPGKQFPVIVCGQSLERLANELASCLFYFDDN